MRRFCLIAACAILGALGSARSATAQDAHAVTQDQLDALIEARTAESEADRAAIARFLGRDDVRDAAATAGIDLQRLEDGVATLDDAEAGRLAERAEATEAALDDDDQSTVVISTTAIIIALLILIVILVAD